MTGPFASSRVSCSSKRGSHSACRRSSVRWALASVSRTLCSPELASERVTIRSFARPARRAASTTFQKLLRAAS